MYTSTDQSCVSLLCTQTGQVVVSCLRQLHHTPSAELELAASCWAGRTSGSLAASVDSLVSSTSGPRGARDPALAAAIEDFTHLVQASLLFPLDTSCCRLLSLPCHQRSSPGTPSGLHLLLRSSCTTAASRSDAHKCTSSQAEYCVPLQGQTARQVAEALQSLMRLQRSRNADLHLLLPVLNAAAARLLELEQQPAAQQPPEQPGGIAKRAWGFVSGLWRAPQPQAEPEPDSSEDTAESLQVGPALPAEAAACFTQHHAYVRMR